MKPISAVIYLVLVLLAAGFAAWLQGAKGWLGPAWPWLGAAGLVALLPLAASVLDRRRGGEAGRDRKD